MQVLVDLSSNDIIGTRSTPSVGSTTTMNGKYIVEMPSGVGVEVSASSYLTPQDASSLPGLVSTQFLERNPGYSTAAFNFFLEDTDIAALDLTAGAPVPTAANVVVGTAPTMVVGFNGPRCQVGRGAGPAPVGIAPGSVAILPANPNRVAPTYGCLITDTTVVAATDEVLIWWKISEVATSEDILAG